MTKYPWTFDTIRKRLATPARLTGGARVLGQLLPELFSPASRGFVAACRQFVRTPPPGHRPGTPILTDAEIDLMSAAGWSTPSMVRLHLDLLESYPPGPHRFPLSKTAREAAAARHPDHLRGLVLDVLLELDPTQRNPLARSPEESIVVPAFLVQEESREPRLAFLNLDLVAKGSGLLYPAPSMAFVEVDSQWREAQDAIREHFQKMRLWPEAHDIRWSISWSPFESLYHLPRLEGNSAGLALAVGIGCLCSKHPNVHRCRDRALIDELRDLTQQNLLQSGFMASLSREDGYLGPVGAPTRKLEAGPSIRVIVAASSFETSHPEIVRAGHGGDFRFAGTFKEAVRLLAKYWRRALYWHAGSVFLVGFLALLLGPVLGTNRLSYDVSSAAPRPPAPSNMVIVSIEDATFVELGRELDGTLSRTNIARFLDRLTRERARLALVDLLFAEPSHSRANDGRLAEAIQANGRVILGALYDARISTDGPIETLIAPIARFRGLAFAWGVLNLPQDPDYTVRILKTRWSTFPTAVWRAATNLDASVAGSAGTTERERWLHYYGSGSDPGFKLVAFHEAVDDVSLPSGYFTGKVVVLGSRSLAKALGGGVDQFGTPRTRFDGSLASGATVHATALANLLDGSWFRKLPYVVQIVLLGAFACFCARVSKSLRNSFAIGAVAIGVLGIVLGSCWVAARLNYWWDWCLPTVVQALAAIMGCLWVRRPRFLS